MTIVKAQVKWVRIGPRKLGLVMEMIRGKNALEALQVLRLMPQKGARILIKVIESAVANAKNNYKLDQESLIVSEIYANKGVTMKRWRARAKGRAFPILKKTSHVTVCVSAKENKQSNVKEEA
ncbi:50S ribosomal protein L22 [candidate division WOR-1 bacterium RIFCSPLOWO2_02_FULL_46_20]|uniref:Large ribosomal subunit protein uL22 n=2 Tax=Saganbacteria TaxID=1703751 RepID=A0A1F4R569_UNCSA|nr:MAG: 50S ribosomal protein L22 [candidate division WOR-1 bacterium RIFCSPHIGHO2_02_FULL_45_12]OGC03270.1 MAG: 50S ribosomal protein L22 [candidate division WOR-1 bacterium RIFCSPLOWO2_02_FULL_46_20]OGC08916.1 MAG: 50S ribosomal protein L22 [candidate division WOR-1 bacterium RIFCSPLOWO2_12_FULL_45_9]